ncbi:DUF1403 family protein [Mesorhizobium sp. B2-6-4]|uniref:DUF1403 family protein n=1 Tax=Mesorhizobium sp. B2-6-4 TaxID=2589913 RepID=UPI001FEE52E6|nr:DUF1403 family protein [Mesorhizobium sp. B2-6-4]
MGHTGQPLDQSFRLCSFPVRKGHRSQSATGALRSCSFTPPRLRLNGGAGLDGLVRQAGAELTAIGSAAGSVRLAGRAEDALRDPWYLRPAGADPGPAGAVLGAWRQLSVQPPAGSADRLERIVDQLRLHCDRAALADLCTEIEKLAGSQRPAVRCNGNRRPRRRDSARLRAFGLVACRPGAGSTGPPWRLSFL